MKFGQLIEYRIFLGNHATVPHLFLRNQNWAYLWINSLKFHTLCFYCMSKSRTTKTNWKQGVNHLLWLHTKLFYKTKRGLKLVFLLHFLHNFSRNIFLMIYSITWPNFTVWLSHFLGYLEICLLYFFVFLSYQDVLVHNQNSQDKNVNIYKQKELLRRNKKDYLSLLKGFHWSTSKQRFWKVRVRL